MTYSWVSDAIAACELSTIARRDFGVKRVDAWHFQACDGYLEHLVEAAEHAGDLAIEGKRDVAPVLLTLKPRCVPRVEERPCRDGDQRRDREDGEDLWNRRPREKWAKADIGPRCRHRK